VSFFIPNLDGKKAALAGLGGGFLGAVTFWIMSEVRDWTGRFGGAALLGFCIGLMVAVVEVAFRRAWLEVRFSEREVITVNLGPGRHSRSPRSRITTTVCRCRWVRLRQRGPRRPRFSISTTCSPRPPRVRLRRHLPRSRRRSPPRPRYQRSRWHRPRRSRPCP